MGRIAEIERITKETQIRLKFDLDGSGKCDITTGIPFFDHMLTLFTVHGFFDLMISANGDLDVDFHHTVEDIGLVLGQAIKDTTGEKKGVARYGYAVTPMDDALATVAVDLSNRPFLVYNLPTCTNFNDAFDAGTAKEFFRAFTNTGLFNLHINVQYGENLHHVLEAIFKSTGRALNQACGMDSRIKGIRSSKGSL
ncbi:MAG: imidazoleglycerol-phosphate dehydratase HisB [Desulfobacteraceae bacterium]|nr:imidazoleglycerol-phosphate dehydratase HisB [Desulfobacteraceae bacterium]